jgi:uncharacterized FlaG/YvyC family protein
MLFESRVPDAEVQLDVSYNKTIENYLITMIDKKTKATVKYSVSRSYLLKLDDPYEEIMKMLNRLMAAELQRPF